MFCKEHGGQIAEPRDKLENELLLSLLPYDAYYWIGLTDLADEGVLYGGGTVMLRDIQIGMMANPTMMETKTV